MRFMALAALLFSPWPPVVENVKTTKTAFSEKQLPFMALRQSLVGVRMRGCTCSIVAKTWY